MSDCVEGHFVMCSFAQGQLLAMIFLFSSSGTALISGPISHEKHNTSQRK